MTHLSDRLKAELDEIDADDAWPDDEYPEADGRPQTTRTLSSALKL